MIVEWTKCQNKGVNVTDALTVLYELNVIVPKNLVATASTLLKKN